MGGGGGHLAPQGILVDTERFQDCHRGWFGRGAAEQPTVHGASPSPLKESVFWSKPAITPG